MKKNTMMPVQNPALARYNFILGSKSPRRNQLLREFGLDFRVLSKSVDESLPGLMLPDTAAVYLSQQKAMAFTEKELGPEGFLITADTVVAVDNTILGKPSGQEDAVAMLKLLAGKAHDVITGVTFRTREKTVSFSSKTRVYFKELTMNEINFYVLNFRPFDKAGAYGIQEWIGYAAVEKIEGSYFNVVGLPLHALYDHLSNW
jgi:septum formation protein